MESKKWSFLKSQKILSTAGIVEVLKITREQKNPIKITFLFSLLSYLFSVKYAILLISCSSSEPIKSESLQFLACPLVQRTILFWEKYYLCIFSQRWLCYSLLAGAADSRATPGRRNCRRIKCAPRQKSLEIPLAPAGLEMQSRGWWGAGPVSVSWFVLLSSCPAAAHSMFWWDLCSSWASLSPKDSSPIPPLPPTRPFSCCTFFWIWQHPCSDFSQRPVPLAPGR